MGLQFFVHTSVPEISPNDLTKYVCPRCSTTESVTPALNLPYDPGISDTELFTGILIYTSVLFWVATIQNSLSKLQLSADCSTYRLCNALVGNTLVMSYDAGEKLEAYSDTDLEVVICNPLSSTTSVVLSSNVSGTSIVVTAPGVTVNVCDQLPDAVDTCPVAVPVPDTKNDKSPIPILGGNDTQKSLPDVVTTCPHPTQAVENRTPIISIKRFILFTIDYLITVTVPVLCSHTSGSCVWR